MVTSFADGTKVSYEQAIVANATGMSVARRGMRVVFEPRARAYDDVAPSPAAELTRKKRTMAGAFQLCAQERWVWNPARNRLWFQTFSHKGLRLMLPVLYVTTFVADVEAGTFPDEDHSYS